jgi:hypothetical protein
VKDIYYRCARVDLARLLLSDSETRQALRSLGAKEQSPSSGFRVSSSNNLKRRPLCQLRPTNPFSQSPRWMIYPTGPRRSRSQHAYTLSRAAVARARKFSRQEAQCQLACNLHGSGCTTFASALIAHPLSLSNVMVSLPPCTADMRRLEHRAVRVASKHVLCALTASEAMDLLDALCCLCLLKRLMCIIYTYFSTIDDMQIETPMW